MSEAFPAQYRLLTCGGGRDTDLVPFWLHREHPGFFISCRQYPASPFLKSNEKMHGWATVTGRIGSPQASISEVLTQSIIECVLILRRGRYSGEEVRVSPFR